MRGDNALIPTPLQDIGTTCGIFNSIWKLPDKLMTEACLGSYQAYLMELFAKNKTPELILQKKL